MRAESLEYQDGDVTLKGFVALDDQSNHKRPGILVMPEAFGLGKQAKDRALRLASLGYAALAGDPYGNGLEVSDLQEAITHAGAIREDNTRFRQRIRAGLDALTALPQVDPDRLVVMGYCMGGSCSLEMARDGAPLKGVVSFTAPWKRRVRQSRARSRQRSWCATARMTPLSRSNMSQPLKRR